MENIFSISQPWTINGIWADGGNQHKTAAIFLSSGLLRSHGPNRLYTECARELAKRGISSLRFDLSGIGDSIDRPNSASVADKTLDEAREVLDAIQEQKGIDRFILIGLCSGAYDGINIATQDKRVVSVVSLDGYSIKTNKFKLHWLKNLVLPRLLRPASWKRLVNRLLGRQSAEAANIVADVMFLEVEAPETIIARFKQLVSREVSLFCLFTGGVINDYSYQGQLADADPALANSPYLLETYYPELDHLMMLDEDRHAVIEKVSEHIETIVGVKQPAT